MVTEVLSTWTVIFYSCERLVAMCYLCSRAARIFNTELMPSRPSAAVIHSSKLAESYWETHISQTSQKANRSAKLILKSGARCHHASVMGREVDTLSMRCHDCDFLSAIQAQIPQCPSKDSHDPRAHRQDEYELLSAHSLFNDCNTCQNLKLWSDWQVYYCGFIHFRFRFIKAKWIVFGHFTCWSDGLFLLKWAVLGQKKL